MSKLVLEVIALGRFFTHIISKPRRDSQQMMGMMFSDGLPYFLVSELVGEWETESNMNLRRQSVRNPVQFYPFVSQAFTTLNSYACRLYSLHGCVASVSCYYQPDLNTCLTLLQPTIFFHTMM